MIVVPTDRKILIYGPSMIHVESAYVEREEFGQLLELRRYMVSMMESFKAIGISAPQVGVFKQFFVMQLENGAMVDFVNPQITWMHGKEILGIEACLSVPPAGNECMVPRMENITIEHGTAESPQFRRQTEFTYRNAVVAQHEYDHLTGTFFFDRVGNSARIKVLDAFKKWKQENKHSAKDNARQLPAHC